MNIYPAMDLMNGACVRLKQRDFDLKTIYDDDPFTTLKAFERDGVEFVHIVDLDGATNPARRQTALLDRIARSSPLKLQIGGGIRSISDAEWLLSYPNVDRVVIGTLAVESPDLMSKMLNQLGGDRLTLAIDLFPD